MKNDFTVTYIESGDFERPYVWVEIKAGGKAVQCCYEKSALWGGWEWVKGENEPLNGAQARVWYSDGDTVLDNMYNGRETERTIEVE